MGIWDDERELILASMRSDVKGARRLLSLGLVDVNTEIWYTPLHYAARNGNTELARLLLDKGANPNSSCVPTPLEMAAKHGHTDLVRLLMDRGADPNITDEDGTTLLHLAAKSGCTSLVKLLIERGVDPNIRDDTGKNPLFQAVEYNNQNRRTEAKNSVRMLLNGGADPNVHAWDPNDIERCGMTPIHQAAEFGLTELVRLLLDRGGDPNETDGVGSTLLHWAAQFGKTDLVNLLMKRGAVPDKKDNIGQTPIHRAAEYGHRDLMRVLARGGASPYDCDRETKSAVDLYQQWYMDKHCKLGIPGSTYNDHDSAVRVEDIALSHRFHLFSVSCMLRCAWEVFKCCSCHCFLWQYGQTNEMNVTYERHPKLISRPCDGQAEGEAMHVQVNDKIDFFDTRAMEESGGSRMGPVDTGDLDEMCAHFVRQDPGRERARERAGRNFSQPRAILSAGLWLS